MIFVEIKDNNEIGLIHNRPFDEIDGLGQTEEELSKKGLLVESLPETENIYGKAPLLKYDGSKLYYDYIDIEPAKEEKIERDLKELKEQNAQMLMALMMGGLM
ncbi:hypothetical protein [Rummeliibacillus sp. TYF-LIM-RU47]|uniref:hypothetical protein n=1 Tax=Rummeliibacillus sp. TYF-LIM-RU47 TaxID=2608406 RepID=UPI00123BE582|nr:hypothetical protein [Rummeliibacillus sp. TYF-LIM-RU47]